MFISQLDSVDLKTKVKNEVLRYIQQMDLRVNTKLPREEDFAKLLGTSRVTLRSVLDDLASEYIIFRIHGKGTFVNNASRDIKISFTPVPDFYEMIEKSGFKPSVKVLDRYYEPAGKELAGPLEMRASSKVLVVKKIFYADQLFCAYIEDYLNTDILDADLLKEQSFESPIFVMLEKFFDVKIAWDKVEIGAALSSDIPELKKIVGPSKALLVLKGANYDANNRPFLYGREYIDTNIIKFNQLRKRI